DDCFCPTPPGVYALAVSGNAVYAAGQFVISPNNFNFNVAKWDGSTWNAVGSGMDYFVNALAVSGSDVYVGGLFGTAGGVAANSIAKWDGSVWSALGSGLNGSVSALALSGSDLYVGGAFTKAGGKISAYVAKAIIGPPPFYFVTTNSSIGLISG